MNEDQSRKYINWPDVAEAVIREYDYRLWKDIFYHPFTTMAGIEQKTEAEATIKRLGKAARIAARM